MERDLVIVGAGPAGLAAAEVACQAGCQVTLIDENASPGGQIWRGADLPVDPRIEVVGGHSVIDAFGRSLWLAGLSTTELRWQRLILATGARELFLPFPGWTLPRVVGVGGLQALSKAGLDLRGKRIAIAGTGPLRFAVAAHAVEQGAEVVAVIEQLPALALAKFGLHAMASAERRRQALEFCRLLSPSRMKLGWWVTSARGQRDLLSIELTDGDSFKKLEVDWLACSWGLVPNTDLAQLLGVEVTREGIVVADDLATSADQIWAAGECTGIGGVEKSIEEGRVAGGAAVGEQPITNSLAKHRDYAIALARTFRIRPEVRRLAGDAEVICRCENVTCGEVRGCASMREAKLYHRLGMGACQGRICSAAGSVLYGWEDQSVRPPLIPTTTAPISYEPFL
ncbi:MAG: Hydrogen cyanide synthase subunit HcnB [Fimbriimonadaceae bacterium]|nr:Hydrogen cyanide synthase subunit HcnB [Fimbriimonadaceae bacterium]